MLTPAVDAYGWPFVILVLVVLVLSIAVGVYDFIRFSRDYDRRQAAMRRHPAGRRVAEHPRPRHGLEG